MFQLVEIFVKMYINWIYRRDFHNLQFDDQTIFLSLKITPINFYNNFQDPTICISSKILVVIKSRHLILLHRIYSVSKIIF